MFSDLALDFFEMKLGFASYFLARLERSPHRFPSAIAPLTPSKLHPTTPHRRKMHDRRKRVDALAPLRSREDNCWEIPCVKQCKEYKVGPTERPFFSQHKPTAYKATLLG
jgi:hypothetical protein